MARNVVRQAVQHDHLNIAFLCNYSLVNRPERKYAFHTCVDVHCIMYMKYYVFKFDQNRRCNFLVTVKNSDIFVCLKKMYVRVAIAQCAQMAKNRIHNYISNASFIYMHHLWLTSFVCTYRTFFESMILLYFYGTFFHLF